MLCEKPVTSNAAELKSLLALAKENGVFFMEAMWTRFQPLARAFKKVLEDGNLGPPASLHADLSADFGIESACAVSSFPSSNGSLLDVQISRRAIGFWIQSLEAGHYLICMSLSHITSEGWQCAQRTVLVTAVLI